MTTELKVFVVGVALMLSGCGAVTAYNRDHTESYMCVKNTEYQAVPLNGQPPLIIEEPKK